MGFPIVECSEEGQFVLSKPPNTGGLISVGSVAEQVCDRYSPALLTVCTTAV